MNISECLEQDWAAQAELGRPADAIARDKAFFEGVFVLLPDLRYANLADAEVTAQNTVLAYLLDAVMNVLSAASAYNELLATEGRIVVQPKVLH